MSGPWEDYKSTLSSNEEDGPWADYANAQSSVDNVELGNNTSSNSRNIPVPRIQSPEMGADQPIPKEKTAMDLLRESNKPLSAYGGDSGDNLFGNIEAGLWGLTGAVAQGTGLIGGSAEYLRKKLAGEPTTFEDEYANSMERQTFEPRGIEGRQKTEAIGDFMNRNLVPVAPMVFSFAGGRPGKAGVKTPKSEANVSSVISAMDKAKASEVPPVEPGVGAFNEISGQLTQGQHSPINPTLPRGDAIGDVVKGLDQMQHERASTEAQAILDARNAEMERGIKKQTTLEMNAAERARQEAAPAISDAHKAIIAEQNKLRSEVEAAQARLEETSRQADQTEAQTKAAQEQQVRINEAQRILDERQTAIDLETKRQYNLDFNAAERARQEKAGIPEGQGPAPDPTMPRETSPHSPEVLRNLQEDQMYKDRPQTDEAYYKRKEQEQLRNDMNSHLEDIQLELENATRPDNSRKIQGPRTIGFKKNPKDYIQLNSGIPLNQGFRVLNRALGKLEDVLGKDSRWQAAMAASFRGKDVYRNPDGTPKVLLHGTTAEIKGGLRTSEEGFHAGHAGESHMFVMDSTEKKTYTKAYFNKDKVKGDGKLYPIVLKEGNYMEIPWDAGRWTPGSILTSKDIGSPRGNIKGVIESALGDRGYTKSQIDGLFNYVINKVSTKERNLAFSDVLKRAGIDGFFYKNQAESPKNMARMRGWERNNPVRDDIINKQMDDPKSFVTWNMDNVRSVFDHTELGNVDTIELNSGLKPNMDFLKDIPGLKEGLRHFIPAKETPLEFIQKVKDSGKAAVDVDQNFVQKAANFLTKGSLYQAVKTDNPIIKYVGEKFRYADGQIKKQIGEKIHDTLAPLAQRLSNKEKADVWALQDVAEAKGFELTPEFMREQGYNQKQVDWVVGHTEVMKDMYEKMSEAMKIAGLKPVSARTAYLASRARGDFRNLVYRTVDGEKQVVGILGANTRFGLQKQAKALLAEHPEYVVGEERYFGGNSKRGTSEGFAQMLEFLSNNDPNTASFIEHVNDLLSKDAYEYMNSSSHTKQKKRVFGMEGRKLYSTALENAKEGMQAQLRYAETMIKWAELSKAVEDSKPLLKHDNGLEMPNAKQWAQEYIQGAMGNSPTSFGRALDAAVAALGKDLGVGTSIGSTAFSTAKQAINGLLLGFWNTGFIGMNLLQPFRTMPEMSAFIRNKGATTGADWGLSRAMTTMIKDTTKGKLSPLEQGAIDFAKQNHVYSSNLFESGNRISKDFGWVWEKGTQSIAAGVEQQTRKLTYLSYVHMLHESGMTAKDGLYATAQNLADAHMNNYSQMEAPRIYQSMGPLGRTGYNLMSFKHNELSRMAMIARDVHLNDPKSAIPVVMGAISMIAFSGLMGTVGFQEANAMIEALSKMMGKPTSLTKMLLENPNISDFFKYGMGSFADVDLTSRMGIQITPGSAMDAFAPGASKLGNIVGKGFETLTSPSEYNAKNFVREAVPNSVAGIVDRAWFSPKNGAGEELSMNRNKLQANAVRNEADKLWKTLGMTGINESKQKALDYANKKIEMAYADKRKGIIDSAAKSLFTSGTIPADFGVKYTEAQGNPSSLAGELETMAMEQKVDQHTIQLMKNAMSSSLTSIHKTMRAVGKE